MGKECTDVVLPAKGVLGVPCPPQGVLQSTLGTHFESFGSNCRPDSPLFFLKGDSGNSLAVHWLGLSALTAVARVQSLVGELRFHKLCGVAKQKKGDSNVQCLY